MRKPLMTLGLALAVSLGGALPAAGQTTLDEAAYLALGRQYYDWFVGGQADSLLAHMSDGTRQSTGGVEGVRQRTDDFMFRAGAESELLVEKMNRRLGHPQYWRESKYTGFAEEPLVFRWLFDEQGQIVGIGITPKSRTPPPDSLPGQ